MAAVRWLLVAIMAMVAAVSVAYSLDLVAPSDASAEAALYYCPMHPQIVQDDPGECPICSMSLMPKPADEASPRAAEAPAEHTHTPGPPPVTPVVASVQPAGERSALAPLPALAPVELSFERTQQIGMRTARARVESLAAEARTVGFVSADESRVARVHARFAGWIEELAASTTGQRVGKGEVLARVYNVELLPAQQEFLAALGWKRPSGAGATGFGDAPSTLAQDARLRLELLGMSPREIDRVAQTGAPSRTVEVVSPRSGHIIRKEVAQGAYVQPGTELFEIADLSQIWVLADIYEHEMGRVRVGQTATVTFDAYPGLQASGKVEFLYPTLNSETRTLRARIALENRDMKLRPGMYGDVVVKLEPERGLVIPREALVDTGDHQYVFVVRGAGRFEPRPVRASGRSGDKVHVLEGLVDGDEVVTTGNFLIDSESRLRAAVTARP